ncbi:hypothetical protein Scep_030560 [Stephania cephalantha]|uniref:Uncharacterized protein n=1 Tax=Stephania cephalantha TaxID=152367 RepID=A0AAP0HEG2_9MAGN
MTAAAATAASARERRRRGSGNGAVTRCRPIGGVTSTKFDDAMEASALGSNPMGFDGKGDTLAISPASSHGGHGAFQYKFELYIIMSKGVGLESQWVLMAREIPLPSLPFLSRSAMEVRPFMAATTETNNNTHSNQQRKSTTHLAELRQSLSFGLLLSLFSRKRDQEEMDPSCAPINAFERKIN